MYKPGPTGTTKHGKVIDGLKVLTLKAAFKQHLVGQNPSFHARKE
jgi:hypothetical protein